jgi:hypothetical protein
MVANAGYLDDLLFENQIPVVFKVICFVMERQWYVLVENLINTILLQLKHMYNICFSFDRLITLMLLCASGDDLTQHCAKSKMAEMFILRRGIKIMASSQIMSRLTQIA